MASITSPLFYKATFIDENVLGYSKEQLLELRDEIIWSFSSTVWCIAHENANAWRQHTDSLSSPAPFDLLLQTLSRFVQSNIALMRTDDKVLTEDDLLGIVYGSLENLRVIFGRPAIFELVQSAKKVKRKLKDLRQNVKGDVSDACDWCGHEADSLKQCFRCKVARYSSAGCQKEAWKGGKHRELCVAI